VSLDCSQITFLVWIPVWFGIPFGVIFAAFWADRAPQIPHPWGTLNGNLFCIW
jgi:hypothetical protein